MIILIIALLALVNALVLFFFVGKVNESLGMDPEFSPTFIEAILYGIVGAIIGKFSGGASFAYWASLFKFKFNMNTTAIIICSVLQYGALIAVVMGLKVVFAH